MFRLMCNTAESIQRDAARPRRGQAAARAVNCSQGNCPSESTRIKPKPISLCGGSCGGCPAIRLQRQKAARQSWELQSSAPQQRLGRVLSTQHRLWQAEELLVPAQVSHQQRQRQRDAKLAADESRSTRVCKPSSASLMWITQPGRPGMDQNRRGERVQKCGFDVQMRQEER